MISKDFMADVRKGGKRPYRQIALKQANGSRVFFSLMDVKEPLPEGFGLAITVRAVPCLDRQKKLACILGSAVPVHIITSVARDEPVLLRQVRVENATHIAYRPANDLREAILLLRSLSKRYTQMYLVGLPSGKL